jgi:hypothetical protein
MTKIFNPFYQKDFYSVDTNSLTAGYLHVAVSQRQDIFTVLENKIYGKCSEWI